MSKKFTSLLVLAILALAIPVQGQDFTKRAVKKQKFEVKHALKGQDFKANLGKAKAAKAKAQDKTEGIAFRGGKTAVEGNLIQAAVNSIENDKAAFAKLMEENMAGPKVAANSIKAGSPRLVPFTAPIPAKGSRRAEVVDAHGIITSPADGEVKYYTRSGTAYYYNSGWRTTTQSGHAEIVECADGTVYFKDPVTRLTSQAYVKGTKSGNTITIPAGQPLQYVANYDATIDLKWGTTAGVATEQPDFTFTIDGTTLTLNGTSESAVFGAFWSDDNSMQTGDYGTVLTLDAGYTPASTDPIEAPAGLTTETWNTSIDGTISTALIGFDGNDVYVKGLFADFPTAWIKGTISGTTITFSKLQFLGTYGSYNIWMTGYDSDNSKFADIVMTYDAAGKKITGSNVILNAADDKLYYLAWYDEVIIQEAAFVEPTIETGDPIDVLPYSNTLTTADEFGVFGVLDANKDEKTWTFTTNNGTNYTYSSANAGDDWLVSPGIKLEAGKTYHFAVDAKNAGYPERLEVKMASEAKESALTEGTAIVAPTAVTSADFVTLENKEVTVTETGYYHFGLHAISDADQYRLIVANFLVEEIVATAPAAVTDLTVTPFDDGTVGATIKFNAPTKNQGGDALTENIAKIEILRDGEVIKTFESVAPGSEQTYVDDSVNPGVHAYQVISYAADATGGKSDVVSVLLTGVAEVPYTADFSEAGVIDLFSVIDANNDAVTWKWSASYGAYYPYGENAGDDYLVSLPIHLQAGQQYDVVVNAKVASANYPERFEVKVGKAATVEGLTITAIAPTDIASVDADDYEGSFSVTEEGNYYVAIHAISDADMWRLSVNSLTIKKGAEPTAPAAVTDFTATPGAQGALEADIAFTAPAKAVNGSDLSGTVDVKVYRDGEVVNTLAGVAPGSAQTWKDTNVENGTTYTYQVIPSNASGDGLKSEKISVFVGFDVPADIEELTATDNATSIHFDWTKVGNVGPNGGYVDPAQVDYEVWSFKVVQSFFGSYLDFDEQLASVKDDNKYDLTYNTDEGEQEYKYWGVLPVNETGEGGALAVSLLTGAPYTLPFVESFEGGNYHYDIWENSENAGLFVSDESSDEDGVALMLTAMEEPGAASINTGKVSIKDAVNPTLVFDVKSATITKLNVIGSVDGAELANIQADVPVTAEYTTVKVPLSSLKNGRFVQVGISANFATPTTEEIDWDAMEYVYTYGDMLTIDNIRIVDLYEYNLGVSVSAPATVTAGQKATVKAVVENKGENAANGYSIVIKAGDKELLNETVNEALAPFKKSEYTADFETSIFDEAGDVTITAEVVFENDLEPDDNKAEGIITIKEPSAPAPEGLTATDKGDAGVDLAWSAPGSTEAAARASVAEETENFDDESVFEPFSVGGITAEQQTGALGDWTLYDGNNMTVYSFNGIALPNANAASAWQVFNTTGDGAALAENYGAHSGNQYLISFCPADQNSAPAANHWLISPELPGIAQTISFYARTITTLYGDETFEVLASSTDNKPESFTIVGSAYSTSATEWTEFTAELPAGTKYFAIRHTSTDVFGLMVDDVTFLLGGAEVKSYNIYYEGEKIADVAGDVTTYTVAANKIQAGKRNFSVTAVYANGSESKPISAQVEVTTGIQQIAKDGKPVDVYALDGKLVRQQTKSLDGLKGVYVINGKKVMIK